MLAPAFDRFAPIGGDPVLLRVALGADVACLNASIDEMTTGFGTIEG